MRESPDYVQDLYLLAFALRNEKPEASQMLIDAADYLDFMEKSLLDELPLKTSLAPPDQPREEPPAEGAAG